MHIVQFYIVGGIVAVGLCFHWFPLISVKYENQFKSCLTYAVHHNEDQVCIS